MNNPMLSARDPLVLQVEARRHELFVEAAHERLVEQALAKSSQRHIANAVIASVGRQLSAIGDALQERFSDNPQEQFPGTRETATAAAIRVD